MHRDRLAIPLSTDPTRQKIWRVVGLLMTVLVCFSVSFLIDRLWHYRSTAARWPAEATLEFRVIKTPRTVRLVEEQFGDSQALPGAPWAIIEALTWSKREFSIYADAGSIVGLRVDGEVPASVQSAFTNWGWQMLTYGNQTLIYRLGAADPLPSAHHTNFWLTVPYFDGTFTALSTNSQAKTLPFHMSQDGLMLPVNMEHYIPTANLALPEDTQLLGFFALSSDEIGAFLPQNISATFPGLQLLNQASLHSGINLLLGIDKTGLAFLAAGQATNFDLEQLGAIATEGAALQSLSTTALTYEEFSNITEIRSANDIGVDVNANDDLSSAIAKNTNGEIFRLTQSDTALILSNRPTFIGVQKANYSSPCLKHAAGFIKPAAILGQVPTLSSAIQSTSEAELMNATEIAFRKHWLKICW